MASDGRDRPVGVYVGMLGVHPEAGYKEIIHDPPVSVRKDRRDFPVGPHPVPGREGSTIYVCVQLLGSLRGCVSALKVVVPLGWAPQVQWPRL